MLDRAKRELSERVSDLKTLDPLKIVQQATDHWKEREKDIITSRNGLFTETGRKMTLDSLGKRYRLSRERVRQIERDVYRKLDKVLKDRFARERALLLEAVEAFGGIAKHNSLTELLVPEPSPQQEAALRVLYNAIPEAKRLPTTKQNFFGWTTKNLSLTDIHRMIAGYLAVLDEHGKILPVEKALGLHPEYDKHEELTLAFLPLVGSRLVVFPAGGGKPHRLLERPKNIGDKIDFVLREAGHPLHFRDITRGIKSANFDNKRVLPETVHNELIADGRFALVGRGLYGLREWKMMEGPVYRVIEQVLRAENRPMKVEEVVERVSSLRNVKKGTIVVNLQTKPQFKKQGKGLYVFDDTVEIPKRRRRKPKAEAETAKAPATVAA